VYRRTLVAYYYSFFLRLYFTRYCSDAVTVWWDIQQSFIANCPQSVVVVVVVVVVVNGSYSVTVKEF